MQIRPLSQAGLGSSNRASQVSSVESIPQNASGVLPVGPRALAPLVPLAPLPISPALLSRSSLLRPPPPPRTGAPLPPPSRSSQHRLGPQPRHLARSGGIWRAAAASGEQPRDLASSGGIWRDLASSGGLWRAPALRPRLPCIWRRVEAWPRPPPSGAWRPALGRIWRRVAAHPRPHLAARGRIRRPPSAALLLAISPDDGRLAVEDDDAGRRCHLAGRHCCPQSRRRRPAGRGAMDGDPIAFHSFV
jgi:hypothetical protein